MSSVMSLSQEAVGRVEELLADNARLRAAIDAGIGEIERGCPLSALNFLLNAKEGLP